MHAPNGDCPRGAPGLARLPVGSPGATEGGTALGMTRAWPLWLAACSASLFVALTVLVVTGVTRPVDSAAAGWLRPGLVWGPWQVRLSPWMTRLEPARMYLLLGVTAMAVALWRRSWRSLAFAALLAGTSAVVTLLAKNAFHRPDPAGYVPDSGGSYPSGHTVAVIVCLSGCLLVVLPRTRWWWWVPVAGVTTLLATALLVSGAHWLTDVLGGALLAVALVAAGSRLPQRGQVRPSAAGRLPPAGR